MKNLIINNEGAFASGQVVQFTDCAEGLLIGFILSLVLRWHFIRFGNVLSNRREIANCLPFIVLIVTLVIMIIHSSLSLSLGLVGALSIVRFRTPIKETEELAYLFMAIATGIGVGAGQIPLTVFGTLLILGTLAVFGTWKTDRQSSAVHISARWPLTKPSFSLETLSASLRGVGESVSVQRMESAGGTTQVLFHLDTPKTDALYAFVEKTSREHPDVEMVVIGQTMAGA